MLKKDYDTRHAFWEKEELEADLEDLLLNGADKPAQEFYQTAFTQFISALQRDDVAAAAAALGLMKQRCTQHRAVTNQLVERATKRTSEDEAYARTQIASSTAIMLAILLASVGLAAAVLYVLARSLMSQLGGEPRYAPDIAGSIAAGNLCMKIDTAPGDRHSLLAAMKAMQDVLIQIVGHIRSGTGTIASASVQIASGNQDLSARTEAQATALEQTTSSVEALTQSVKHNAGNARQAQQLALSASDVAVRGGAVVASEVRNLAQRSSAAAREIKALIDTSVQTVDAGARLVNEAGATMNEVVVSVHRVTDMISGLSTASSEQTSGIEQIGVAIRQLDGVTQQNAALVEEASAAAHSMQDQAQQLSASVSTFKLA